MNMDNEFSIGTTFDTPDGRLVVTGRQTDSDYKVTDPDVRHPQDARASTWNVPRDELMSGLRSGKIRRGDRVPRSSWL